MRLVWIFKDKATFYLRAARNPSVRATKKILSAYIKYYYNDISPFTYMKIDSVFEKKNTSKSPT